MARRLAAILFALLAALVVFSQEGLRPLDHRLSELRFDLATRSPTGRVAVVEIDSRSLAAVGVWPWPRSIHAEMVDTLIGLGAADIAFDVDFSARSTTDEDAALTAALARAGGGVILAVFNQASSSGTTALIANSPIPELAAHSWPATVNVRPDIDGQIRQFSFGEEVNGTFVPSMPMMLAGGAASRREFFIDFSIDAAAIQRISAIDLIEGRVPAERVRGRGIIIGASAAELRDIYQVPVWGFVSGAHLQAIAAESLMLGRALDRPGLLWTIGAAVLALLAACLPFGRAGWRMRFALIAAAAGACETAAMALFLFQPILPDTSLALASLGFLAVAVVLQEIDFRRILIAIARTDADNRRRLFHHVIDDNFAGVVIADRSGAVLAANRAAIEAIGSGKELTGLPAANVLPEPLLGAMISVLAGEHSIRGARRAEIELAGVRRAFDYAVTPSHLSGGVDEDGRAQNDRLVATLTFLDVTEQRRAEQHLAFLARFDPLTELANRNQLLERLAEAIEGGLVVHVVCLDLNRFKQVNAALGHTSGDALLRAVAERLRAHPVTCLARSGGDEFGFFLEGRVEADVAGLAEEILVDLTRPYAIGSHTAIVGISLGVAKVDGVDAATALRQADVALHRAKQAGDGKCRFFTPDMVSNVRRRQDMEVALRAALPNRELEVFYQPQVDLRAGGIVGVEALVRWHHPQLGLVSPLDFIALAEETGLIEQVGVFVLERACRDACAMPGHMKVSINVSPAQFQRGDLVASVRQALERSGLPPARLDLEITESLFIQGGGGLAALMKDITNLGVSFSLDDFGTGYSSLSYIRDFPVAKVKIDKSFVDGIATQLKTHAIVQAIIALTASLGVRSNAEGIETEEQAELLRQMGCLEAQGYLFGKPVPLASLLTHIEAPAGATQAA
jgi:diguanylate cyclase (GGDEF)-like protein